MKRRSGILAVTTVVLALFALFLFKNVTSDLTTVVLYPFLDYRAIDAKGIARTSVESAYAGCTAKCDDGDVPCEEHCACIMHHVVKNMSKPDAEALLAAPEQAPSLSSAINAGYEKALAACKLRK